MPTFYELEDDIMWNVPIEDQHPIIVGELESLRNSLAHIYAKHGPLLQWVGARDSQGYCWMKLLQVSPTIHLRLCNEVTTTQQGTVPGGSHPVMTDKCVLWFIPRQVAISTPLLNEAKTQTSQIAHLSTPYDVIVNIRRVRPQIEANADWVRENTAQSEEELQSLEQQAEVSEAIYP